jgi:hypothetical protein
VQLYLQIGHGMMAHTKELIGRWGGGGAILSPRDLDEDQLRRVAAEVTSAGGEPLLDPQCYIRSADHEKLVAHSYWAAIAKHATGAFTGGPGTDALLGAIASLASTAGIHTHIVPACIADPVDDVWLSAQATVIRAARKHFDKEPLLATIALSAASARDEEQVEAIIESAAEWKVKGYYVVVESPGGYLVDDPVWLTNVCLLASGLKLHHRRVVLGYAPHQLLCLAAANVDEIACGTFLNVRSFDPEKFFEKDTDDISRRAVWYYAPESLSEYKLPFLDLAMSAGVLSDLRPPKKYQRDYSDPLFQGVQPSTVGWKETEAFRHYLDMLCQQAREVRLGSFDDTVSTYEQRLDRAEKLIAKVSRQGVRGQDRDFRNMIDVNRSAIARLTATRGARLRRNW